MIARVQSYLIFFNILNNCTFIIRSELPHTTQTITLSSRYTQDRTFTQETNENRAAIYLKIAFTSRTMVSGSLNPSPRDSFGGSNIIQPGGIMARGTMVRKYSAVGNLGRNTEGR